MNVPFPNTHTHSPTTHNSSTRLTYLQKSTFSSIQSYTLPGQICLYLVFLCHLVTLLPHSLFYLFFTVPSTLVFFVCSTDTTSLHQPKGLCTTCFLCLGCSSLSSQRLAPSCLNLNSHVINSQRSSLVPDWSSLSSHFISVLLMFFMPFTAA